LEGAKRKKRYFRIPEVVKPPLLVGSLKRRERTSSFEEEEKRSHSLGLTAWGPSNSQETVGLAKGF